MLNTYFLLFHFVLTSIYSYQYQNPEGQTIGMNTCQGKKILIVNIATGSPRVSQLSALQQLRLQFGDSLEIIAFPSNSFGHESRSNAEIKQFCQTNYNTTFKIGAKTSVSGSNVLSIYNWLTNQAENGTMHGEVIGDFQKFLINKEGQLIGVFAPAVSPIDPSVINAINEN